MPMNGPEDLIQIIRKTIKDMRKAGLQPGTVNSVRWSSRMHRTKGNCQKRKDGRGGFEIAISTDLLTCPEALRDTVCHELIHTLPGCFNHGDLFQLAAARMNARGYQVSQSFNPDLYKTKGYEETYTWPRPKYVLVCTRCQKQYPRARRSKSIEHPELYRCHCGGELRAYQIKET